MVYRNYAAMTLRHSIGEIFHDIRCGFIKDGDRLGIHKAPRFEKGSKLKGVRFPLHAVRSSSSFDLFVQEQAPNPHGEMMGFGKTQFHGGRRQ